MNEEREDADAPEVPGLRGLRLDQAPARDLWPDIASRLRPRRRGPPAWLGYAAAASVAATVGLTLWREAPPAPATETATAAAAPAFAERLAPLLAEAPRQNHALVKANLKIVRDAENQVRHALKQDPESASLRRLLVSMQDQGQDLNRMLAQGT